MSHVPYTQKRNYQFRGPSSSKDYNLRIEENAKDLTVLYNLINKLEALNEEATSYLYKEVRSIVNELTDLETRIATLEEDSTVMAFIDPDQIDDDEFSATQYEITKSDRLTYHSRYNFLTLPHIPSSSVSKLKYQNQDGTYNTSPELEILVVGDPGTADSNSAVIETSQPVYAIVHEVGRIWQRNVITNDLPSEAACDLFIRIPQDLSITSYTNALLFDAWPIYGVSIDEISYSTDPHVNLSSSAAWTPLNDTGIYYGIKEAVGHLPPGSWETDGGISDKIENAGPLAFYFGQKSISAFKIRLRLDNSKAFADAGKYIWSYGMSHLDIRYDKFNDTGSAIIRFEAKPGTTISQIESVTPHIWNVPEHLVNDVFDYQVIWETSPGSGIYTDSPVPLSQRVWLKINLNKGTNGDQLPTVSNILVKYS